MVKKTTGTDVCPGTASHLHPYQPAHEELHQKNLAVKQLRNLQKLSHKEQSQNREQEDHMMKH